MSDRRRIRLIIDSFNPGGCCSTLHLPQFNVAQPKHDLKAWIEDGDLMDSW